MIYFTALVGALLLAQTELASLPAPVVLTNVSVIDCTGAPVKPGMSVVISGGRIRSLGKSGTVTVPAGARVVDATGKYLIPGLWDMHVHWYHAPTLPVFIANGVTGVRIMAGFPVHLRWRHEIDEGTLLGPRLVLAGPIVDGPNPVWPDSLKAASDGDGRLAVRTIGDAGYDCVKVYHLLSRAAYLGVAAEANRRGLPLVGHVPFDVSAAEASAAGQRSIEHLSGVALACSIRETELRRNLLAANQTEAAPPRVLLRFEIQAEESRDPDKAASLFSCFVKNGTWHVPTLAVRQSHAMLQAHKEASDPRLRYLSSSLRERWENRRAATFKKLGPAEFDNFRATLRNSLDIVNSMHHAGVQLLAGTDTGALDCYPGFSLHEELELLVQAGLTPLEALQTATFNPARFLNRTKDMGTVERGKWADLVLLDANPLDDIRNTRRIYAVVCRGRLLLRPDLQRLLSDAEAACRHNDSGEFGPQRKIP
jgi:hypothetical protein